MATKKDNQPVDVSGGKLNLSVGPAGNPDYVPFGSEAHASLLLLQKAEQGDVIRLADNQGREWTLADLTNFPPGTTEQYLRAILGQRVRVLSGTPSVPPGSPPLWMPDNEARGVTGG